MVRRKKRAWAGGVDIPATYDSIIIGGKEYKNVGHFKKKSDAVKKAKSERENNWNARVIHRDYGTVYKWHVYSRFRGR